jgi:hypothetical protein
MKADAGGRELFSGFHFGMDDCGNEFCFDARPHPDLLPQEKE